MKPLTRAALAGGALTAADLKKVFVTREVFLSVDILHTTSRGTEEPRGHIQTVSSPTEICMRAPGCVRT